MSAWPWVGKPPPGATRSSLMTRNARNPMWAGSCHSPNEKVWRLSSQSMRVRPRSAAGLKVSMLLATLRDRRAGVERGCRRRERPVRKRARAELVVDRRAAQARELAEHALERAIDERS